METTPETIIKELNKSFNEPSSAEQEQGCLKAITETLDYLAEYGGQCDFLIELRDFIIRYNKDLK